MIAKKRIKKPEELNKLALQNSENFIAKVKEYAQNGRAEEKEMQEKLDNLLEKFQITFKKHQAEKRDKINTSFINKNESNNEQNINSKLVTLNKKLQLALIIVVLFLLSFIWWSFDKLLNIPYINQSSNYWLIKIPFQLMIITLTLAIFNKNSRAAWITTSIALLIFFLSMFRI
jgi:hypothetical protein